MGLEIPGVITQRKHPDLGLKKNQIQNNNYLAKQLLENKTKTVSYEEIKKSIAALEKTAFIFNKRLKFRVNKEIDRVIVKVIDVTTDKVIKEIPPAKIQRLIARIKQAIGLLVDERF